MYRSGTISYDVGVNLLAIDTSTEACSAALLREDGELFHQFEIAPRQHTRLLPAMIDSVIDEAAISSQALTHCAFANGPGAFTGIRIAAAQAQGIGLGLGIKLVPVSTLAVLAQTGIDRLGCQRPLVALDARMQEIYWAVYRRDEQGIAQLHGEERLTSAEAVEIAAEVDRGLGHGWIEALRDGVSIDIEFDLLPDARAMLTLAADAIASGQDVYPSAVTINYLRNRVAEKAAS